MDRILSIEQLCAGKCVPMKNRLPMKDAHIEEQIQVLHKWVYNAPAGALVCTFDFPDYAKTIDFVNKIAAVAEAQNHHPDLRVSYGKVQVVYSTHSIGGVSMNDFICAAQIDVQYPKA